MKNQETGRENVRRRRLTILVAVGVVAVGLGIGSIGAVLARGDAPSETPSTPTETPAPTQPSASPSAEPEEPTPSEAPTPAPDPHALADGVYPTFVRGVDVEDSKVTIDVLQLFTGEAAHKAAVEDGVKWSDVQYDPVYLRNENPLLRTLPVADGTVVTFLGGCEFKDTKAGLERLRRETREFTDALYYDVTVEDGTIVAIEQHIAISAC